MPSQETRTVTCAAQDKEGPGVCFGGVRKNLEHQARLATVPAPAVSDTSLSPPCAWLGSPHFPRACSEAPWFIRQAGSRAFPVLSVHPRATGGRVDP